MCVLESVCVEIVCVYVMDMAHRGIFVLGGAVVRITAAHHQVMGSSPIRKVLRSFLVAFQTLPRIISRPFFALGTLGSPLTIQAHDTHTRTHTRTHSPTHPHTHCVPSCTHTHTRTRRAHTNA